MKALYPAIFTFDECDETFPKGIKNKLIKFDKNSRSNSFLVRIDEGANEFAQAYLCQTTSDKDNAIIDSLLYYFAKIVVVEKNTIGVDIISVNRIDKTCIKSVAAKIERLHVKSDL